MTRARPEPTVVPGIRLKVDKLAPHINKAMDALELEGEKVSLELPLLELIRTRASQINGCAYCVDAHSKDAHDGGESERRLFALPAWREAPFFTARERAALELTEAVTRLSTGPVSDDTYERAAAQFTEVELAELIWTITIINAWNRVAAAARPWPIV